MTAQNTFPKVDGDIIYASEINRFAYASYPLYCGSSPVVGSQTGVTFGGYPNIAIAGSVLVPANTLTNPVNLEISWTGSMTGSSSYFWQFSGLSANTAFLIGSLYGFEPEYGQGYATLGSPLEGFIAAKLRFLDGTQNNLINGSELSSFIRFSHLNVGSPFLISWGFNNPFKNMSYKTVSIQALRGSIQ